MCFTTCWFDLLTSSIHLGGGFKHFLFSSLFGEDFQFDSYFSNGLKPPTSHVFLWNILRHHCPGWLEGMPSQWGFGWLSDGSCDEAPQKGTATPLKTNIATKNDGLYHVSPFKYGVIMGIYVRFQVLQFDRWVKENTTVSKASTCFKMVKSKSHLAHLYDRWREKNRPSWLVKYMARIWVWYPVDGRYRATQLIWQIYHYLQGFSTNPGGCLGFLNRQQYGLSLSLHLVTIVTGLAAHLVPASTQSMVRSPANPLEEVWFFNLTWGWTNFYRPMTDPWDD